MTNAKQKMINTLKVSVSDKTEKALYIKQTQEKFQREIFELNNALNELLEEINYQNQLIQNIEQERKDVSPAFD